MQAEKDPVKSYRTPAVDRTYDTIDLEADSDAESITASPMARDMSPESGKDILSRFYSMDLKYIFFQIQSQMKTHPSVKSKF